MNISSKHPSYMEFITNEINTLGRINGLAPIASNFPSLSTKAQAYYNQYKPKKGRENLKFTFNCELNLMVEKKQRIVLVEALQTPDFGESGYVISICEDFENGIKILRKFHFDYAPNAINEKIKKPIYHFQYGGKPTPLLNELEIDCSHLNTWLSSPRLFFIPINLALVLDLVFCEFQCVRTLEITEDPKWRDLIKTNEAFLTQVYFSRVNDFFSQKHQSNFLYREFNYGKR